MRFMIPLCMAALVVAGSAVQAQQSNPFANPQNLKVLPKDIDPDRLRNIMRGISMATGLRCNGCHVQAEGKPLFEWDFSLDDKREKQVARDMLRMTGEINKTIGNMDGLKNRDQSTVRVTCMTCHHGVPRPETIQAILDGFKEKNDGAGAVVRYQELREIYYGSHTYDFTPFTLGNYAVERSEEGLTEFAAALHKLNRELNPDASSAYYMWGQSLMIAEDYEGAAAAFRKALELEPDNQFIKGLLARAERALSDQSKDG